MNVSESTPWLFLRPLSSLFVFLAYDLMDYNPHVIPLVFRHLLIPSVTFHLLYADCFRSLNVVPPKDHSLSLPLGDMSSVVVSDVPLRDSLTLSSASYFTLILGKSDPNFSNSFATQSMVVGQACACRFLEGRTLWSHGVSSFMYLVYGRFIPMISGYTTADVPSKFL